MKATKTNTKYTYYLPKKTCTCACKYNDNNVCFICHRTKKEIFEWGDYTDE
ncbi:MAG: DUF1289 domain-containing protein, partial [Bacteroidales bacterium]|nr:DUF1289 domain-containing protein [Bacteroidales bacterium]